MECQLSNYSSITLGSLAVELEGMAVSRRPRIKDEGGLFCSSSIAEWVELRDKDFLLCLASKDTRHWESHLFNGDESSDNSSYLVSNPVWNSRPSAMQVRPLYAPKEASCLELHCEFVNRSPRTPANS